jgi:catechol 2,3-dioxygenase-like lactoylglutathione lyase family enzyme
MDYKLELVLIPVSDVDRAKAFYTENVGFTLDVDHRAGDDFRVVQMTPPGSPTAIIFGTGVTAAEPGSAEAFVLAVHDIDAARADLVARGVDVSEVFHGASGFDRAGTAARVSGPDPERQSYKSWVSFSDPDGNGWLIQELTTRLPGR